MRGVSYRESWSRNKGEKNEHYWENEENCQVDESSTHEIVFQGEEPPWGLIPTDEIDWFSDKFDKESVIVFLLFYA